MPLVRLPGGCGFAATIHNRFVRWAKRGVGENLFQELSCRDRSTGTQIVGSTHVKVYRSAGGGPSSGHDRRVDFMCLDPGIGFKVAAGSYVVGTRFAVASEQSFLSGVLTWINAIL